MIKRVLSFIVVCLMPMFLWAQSGEHFGISNDSTQSVSDVYGYSLIVRSYGDSVVFRWAPSNAGIWMLGNSYGWKIARSSDDPMDTVYEHFLTPEPIKPMTLEQMIATFDSTNLLAGAAAQALYGPSYFDPQNTDATFTNYVFRKDQEQRQRQMMAYLAAEADPQVASALGLRFVDKNVKPGQVHQYTIYPQIPAKYAKMAIISKVVYVQPFHRTAEEMLPPIVVKQIDPYRAAVLVRSNKLSGYYFERSTDGKHWQKINESPIYVMDPQEGTAQVYGDSVAEWMKDNAILVDSLELRKSYIYRVRAFDAFGDFAPEQLSDKFEMEDLIPPYPPTLHTIIPEQNTICNLRWDQPLVDDDLDGFMVMFSRDINGKWDAVSELLPAKTRTYVDKEAGKRSRGFYRILAVDKSGNFSFSTPVLNNIEDIIPPEAPTGLRGLIDENGALYLDWRPNQENDILGYRVYYANQADHDFIECSGGYLSSPNFQSIVDSKTITMYIYYYVVAVDQSYNYSKPSDTLQLRLPDSIPPGVVLLESVRQEDGAVYANWRQSVSQDVTYYYIYRKPKPAKRWECIYIASPNDVAEDGMLHFVDYPPVSDVPYSYSIEAMDDWRNASGKNGEFTVFVDPPKEIDAKIKLNGSYNKEMKGVELTWTYEYNGDDEHYGVVYRSLDGIEWRDIYSFKRGDKKFVDTTVEPGSKPSYYIQFIFEKGRHSKPSKVVKTSVSK